MTSDRPDGAASQSSGLNAPARWQDALPSVVAFALYAVLLDAAAETWWSGSPVRWWVVGAVAIYAVSTALLWRRITWRSKATISAFVFLGVVAITVWLPGGLRVGMRLASRPTSTLLSLLTAAAVVLAAGVVWRFRVIPTAVRTGVGLLAAYGLTAFVYGVITGVPFSALLSGDSVWQRLPALLQGAFVGGLIVLPLAILTSVVRAGIPRFREGSPRHALYQIVALATSLAIVIAALPVASQWRNDSRAGTAAIGFSVPVTTPIVPSAVLSDALENSLRAVADGERESPRDRWDPAYVVEHVGKDPQQLFEWVAGNTSWIPYRGLLRGPVGVLMDRMGSSLDRAVLLATLLKQAGHSVRLAHGELAADDAMGLLPALIVARTGGMVRESRLKPIDAGEVQQVAAQYSLDGPAIEQSLGSYAADSDRVFSALDVRVADQTARLRAAVGVRAGNSDRSARIDSAIDLLRDHWWVQRQNGGSWVDLDLLSPDTKALTTAQETVALDGLAPSQVHQVVVRVVAEQWNDGKVAERTALEHVLRPSELIDKPIVLALWPMYWPAEFLPRNGDPHRFLQTTAIRQHEWLPTLKVGRETIVQSSIRDTGDLNEHPATTPMKKIGASVARGVDGVADLLGSIGREKPEPAAQGVLTAAWIDYEIRVPGERPRIIRRAVFDLLGSAARAARPVPPVGLDDARSLHRSLSLMMQTEIVPVVARLPPGFLAHLTAQALLANREVLRSLVRGDLSEETKPQDLYQHLEPLPSPLYRLAVARMDWSSESAHVFADRPNVLTRHLYLASAAGTLVLRDASDIVSNEVGVDLGVADAFGVRLAQGVFDTNAESLVHAGSSAVASTAEAFVASRDWVTLTSPSDSQLPGLSLTEDVRRHISENLAAGYIVVAPKAPVALDSGPFVGWWRVDPQSGHALGVDSTGWGAELAEYGLTVLYAAGLGYLFGWAVCVADRYNSPPVASNFSDQRWDYLITPLAAMGNTGCLGEAIKGAIIGAIFGLAIKFNPGGGRPPIFGNGGGGGGGGAGGGGAGAGGGGTGSGGGGTGAGSGGTGSGGSGSGPGGRPAAPPGEPPPGSSNTSSGRSAQPSELPPPTPDKGPYRGDPVGRDLIKNNPDSVASKAMGGPELFEGADQAASKAYNAGKQMGMGDEAAHDMSQKAWDNYVERWTPEKILTPGVPGGRMPYGRIGREVVPGNQPGANPLGGTTPAGAKGGTLPLQGPSPCAAPPCGLSPATQPIGGGPSPQAKSVGGLTNLGNVLKGGS